MTRAGIIAALDGKHPRLGRSIALAIYAMILISALAIAIETVPGLTSGVRRALLWVEIAILVVFAVEYALRLICSPRPLTYAFSFWGIIDFLAVVPAILFFFPDAQSIRAIRLLRLARLLKLFHANAALDRIAYAFAKNRSELLIFTFIAFVALYLAAVGIYHFEHAAQPDAFGSIPQSLWWAVATLSTVGYGDVYPVTVGGRVFTGIVLLVGIGIVAVPAGLVTSALLSAPHTANLPEPPTSETPDPNDARDNKEDT